MKLMEGSWPVEMLYFFKYKSLNSIFLALWRCLSNIKFYFLFVFLLTNIYFAILNSNYLFVWLTRLK